MAVASKPPVVRVYRHSYVPTGLVVALVLLRLVVGWHFFREGSEKLAYNPTTGELRVAFSAEKFFRMAVGPVAELVHDKLPEAYNWERYLAVPREAKPSTKEEIEARAKWQREYDAKVKAAEAKGEPAPIEFPPSSPYFDWADRIDAGWHGALDRFSDVEGISDEQRAKAKAALDSRRRELADYLEGEADAIAEWEHELYRLSQWEAQAGSKDIPFMAARITEKRGETTAASAGWISAVRDIEDAYLNDLRELLTPAQRANPDTVAAVDEALADSTQQTLHRLNVAVTCLVLGVGICLLLGLFTRLAALGGIVFLAMVMASQPPWVEGAHLDFFYYQLVEIAALIVLLASAAGRWGGLDFFLRALAGKCCGRKETASS